MALKMTVHPAADGNSRVVLDAIRKIVRALRVASRDTEKRVGLSGAQVFVLQKLADGQALSMKELAARTLTHPSSVSVVVHRLVERGLIQRTVSPLDRRRVELTLTDAGRAATGTSHDLAQDRLIAGLHAMPLTRRKHLADLLKDLIERSGLEEELDVGPAPLFFEDDGAAAPRKDH